MATAIHPSPQEPKQLTFDVFEYLSFATLDIIGITGFNFDFRALPSCLEQTTPSHDVKNSAPYGDEEARLKNAGHDISAFLAQVSSPALPFPFLLLVKGFITFLRVLDKSYVRPFIRPILERLGLDKQSGQAHQLRQIFRGIGTKLVRREKQNGVKGRPSKRDKEECADIGQGRDLLSLMMKSNMASNLPADKRMTVEQILEEIPTFMLAGELCLSLLLAMILTLRRS
jgi:hypothetical protein